MVDLHLVLAVVGVALVGGLVGLDRTAAGQFMISQPIVAAPLAGWLLGDANAGFIIGAMLQLIWVLDMPVGSFVPANATVSAVTATAVAALTCPGGAPRSLIGFSILLSVGTVPFTMMADTYVRTWNSRLVDAAHTATGVDSARSLSKAHLTGLCAFFLKSAVLYALLLPAGLAAAALFLRAPATVHGRHGTVPEAASAARRRAGGAPVVDPCPGPFFAVGLYYRGSGRAGASYACNDDHTADRHDRLAGSTIP